MKNPFKTGRLITDRLIGKVSAFCLICMAILLPLCGVYYTLRNGYNRQNALAERTRDRGYKILERCNTKWNEVNALQEDLKSAMSVASRLKYPEHDDLLTLWEECKRDIDCKRKDSRRQAQELSSTVKTALDAYRKAKDQIKGLQNFIEEDAKLRSEKIVAIDISLREKLCRAIESLKSELSRPLPMNTVSVGEYLKSCIGLVEINGQERIQELESRYMEVEGVLTDGDMNRGDAKSLSQKLRIACENIRDALKEMREQEEVGRKAYNAFLTLPLDAGRTMSQFWQKHLTPLSKQIEEMDERLKVVIEKWESGVCQESLEEIHTASNSINSAAVFVAENRMELSQSTVESLDVPRSKLNDCIFAVNKCIEDFGIGQKKAIILKHIADLKNGCSDLEKEFEKVEKSGEATDEVSRMLIDKVGKIKSGKQDIAAEISGLEQSIDDVRKCELKKLISVTQEFKDAVAKAADTLPRVEYEAGLSAICVPFKGNHGVTASDIEHMMKGGNGEVVSGYRPAISFDKFNLENEAKNDFTAYRVFRFDFSIKGEEINGLENIVLKLSKNGHTLRKGSNRGFPGKLKVNCSLRAKGIELSQNVSQDKEGIDKNRSDSMNFLIPLKDSRQTMRYGTFNLLIWISPYRETGWDYSGLSVEVFGVTTHGNRKELSLLHEVSR